jgi:hypothetical protein
MRYYLTLDFVGLIFKLLTPLLNLYFLMGALDIVVYGQTKA